MDTHTVWLDQRTCQFPKVYDKIAIPYLDDIIVFNRSFEEHVEHVWTVLRRLRQQGIKLKPAKCKLFRKEVCFLGRIVSKDGYRVDPSGITAVTSLAQEAPKTVETINGFSRLLSSLYSKLCLHRQAYI